MITLNSNNKRFMIRNVFNSDVSKRFAPKMLGFDAVNILKQMRDHVDIRMDADYDFSFLDKKSFVVAFYGMYPGKKRMEQASFTIGWFPKHPIEIITIENKEGDILGEIDV